MERETLWVSSLIEDADREAEEEEAARQEKRPHVSDSDMSSVGTPVPRRTSSSYLLAAFYAILAVLVLLVSPPCLIQFRTPCVRQTK